MKKKKKIILVSFTYLFFSSIVQGFLSLRSIFFGNSDLEKEKKKKKGGRIVDGEKSVENGDGNLDRD